MQTLIDFIDLLLGFLPAVGLLVITLIAFWIATLLIPGLDDWMRDGRDMEEAEEYNKKLSAATRPHRW